MQPVQAFNYFLQDKLYFASFSSPSVNRITRMAVDEFVWNFWKDQPLACGAYFGGDLQVGIENIILVCIKQMCPSVSSGFIEKPQNIALLILYQLESYHIYLNDIIFQPWRRVVLPGSFLIQFTFTHKKFSILRLQIRSFPI